MKTNIYIDAFNLYYGSLKGTSYRWLNVVELARALLPRHQIHRVRYFTAIVKTDPNRGDGKQAQRQQVYIRALETLPELEVHLGHYLSHPTTMALETPGPGGQKFARVIKTEEKGSDVNLATYLLLDGFKKDYEQALVISNDSDLATPVELVQKELGFPVGVAFPCSNGHRKNSVRLKQVATFVRQVRKPTLATCLLPGTMTDANGSFQKPAKW